MPLAASMEAVVFTGIQAAGKSTFFKAHFVDTHIRINLDMLRTRHREKLLIAACLQAKQRFVVENTNLVRSGVTGFEDVSPAAHA